MILGRLVSLTSIALLLSCTEAAFAQGAADRQFDVRGRIESDDAAAFGESPTRIDFQADPEGVEFTIGEDIGHRFVAWGCVLRSSLEKSFVSVEPYNVGGRSGGRCAGTHDPLYQGTITIRFCVPGKIDRPAGVHSVGCWVSHVAPGGTALVAYDKDGERIGVVKTTLGVKQFLGIHSSTPIVRVEIVPDPAIDPDFAFDDLTFDKPGAVP
jgi:hypothetical protein